MRLVAHEKQNIKYTMQFNILAVELPKTTFLTP